jgi:hypothetical protein
MRLLLLQALILATFAAVPTKKPARMSEKHSMRLPLYFERQWT